MQTSTGFEAAALPPDETERLRALQRLHVLDTPPEPVFEDIVWLAAQLCAVPTALVTLVDAKRQWFKARCGLDPSETPRDFAFCAHTILSPEIFEVPDTLKDPRFAGNPLVTGSPGIRFYAGAPLNGKDGYRYGSLCVIDAQPRRLEACQREALVRLARQAVSHLESRTDRLDAQTQQQTLARLLEAMPDGVVSCDADGLLAEFNSAARDWHGVDPRALTPGQWASHFDLYEADGQQHLATARIPLLRAWQGESVRASEIVIKAAGQPPRAVLCNAERLLSLEGAVLGAVCVMHDISEIRASEVRLRTIADNVPALIAQIGEDLRCQFVNDAFMAFFSDRAGPFVGEHLQPVLGAALFAGIEGDLSRALANQRPSFDCLHVDAAGQSRHLHVTCIPDVASVVASPDAVRPRGFYLMAHDITAHKQHAQAMEQRATRDELTGLANRAGWSDQFKHGLLQARAVGAHVAVMFLDLDDFKLVNDKFGHEAGDAVLREFAIRLKATLRPDDVVARLSGDEFVVLLNPIGDPGHDPAIIARKVLAATEPELLFQGSRLAITPSIGIAVHSGPDFEPAALTRLADQAMYAAKRSKIERFVVLTT